MPNVHITRDVEGERTLPVFREISDRLEAVRKKAFELFQGRGGELGHELEDWVAAEHAVMGWPAAEVTEKPDAFEVEVTLPGFAATEVEVTASPKEIIVHAASHHERKGEDTKVIWSEYGSNDVYRRFALPTSVNADKVSAHLDDGILHVIAPKVEVGGGKRISVSPA